MELHVQEKYVSARFVNLCMYTRKELYVLGYEHGCICILEKMYQEMKMGVYCIVYFTEFIFPVSQNKILAWTELNNITIQVLCSLRYYCLWCNMSQGGRGFVTRFFNNHWIFETVANNKENRMSSSVSFIKPGPKFIKPS